MARQRFRAIVGAGSNQKMIGVHMTDIEVIDRFVSEVEYLKTLSYTQELKKPISVSMQFARTHVDVSREGPADESLRAFLLSFRLFRDDKEQISIRNMAERVDTLPIEESLKQAFSDGREALNHYLDSTHRIPEFHIGDRPPLTNRQIFDAFTFGKYAHLTQSKTVEHWEQLVCGESIRAAYDQVLRQFFNYLSFLSQTAADIANELRGLDDSRRNDRG
jgi:hypothetical protein